jgi:signal transduction histidine kinase
VEDTGPGISARDRERVFDKFARGAAASKEKRYGAGLGLAFCRMATEAQGGTISLESEPGKGARFEVRLPAAHT